MRSIGKVILRTSVTMSNILRLRKTLIRKVRPDGVPGLTIRPFAGPDDVPAWLALRAAAFADFIAAGRPWSTADFDREFTAKPWWSCERMWLAILESRERTQRQPRGSTSRVVGSVTLGHTGRSPDDVAAIQWLMVAPTHRRRGIGTALLQTAERQALELGERELTLETHSAWTDAMRLYRRHGYV